MKLPNLRLDKTKATTSLVLGIIGLLGIMAMAVIVFKGFDGNDNVIRYHPKAGFSQYRPYIVFAATPTVCIFGFLAGVLGFQSLGQKRNDRQRHSWLGLISGALSISLALVMFFAWMKLKEAIIIGQ